MTSPAGAQLNGVTAQFARVTLPYYGRWHTDVRLMGGATDVSGPQVLTFAGITYNCAIKRAKDEAGALSVRLVGGTGGLGKTMAPRAYSSASGVMLSVVLQDLASECGEVIMLDGGDRSLGQAYVRMAMPAARVLNDVLGDHGWWMDPAGTIHTGPRVVTPIGTEFTATQWRGAQGIYSVAPVVPSDWTPGRTFANTSVSGTISRVEHDVTAKAVRSTVMVGDPATDRLKDPLDSVIEESQAALLYYLTWPYTVLSVSPGPPVTMQLSSNDSRAPDLQRITLWPGPSGAWATPPTGASVRVRFVAADPTQPEIVGLDPANQPTTTSVFAPVVKVGDSAARPVAHSAEVAADMTALQTLITALDTWATATIVTPGGTFTDPGATLTSTLVTACTTAISAITAQAPTLPTVKGSIT